MSGANLEYAIQGEENDMGLFAMLVMTALRLWLLIGACRILSMTFRTFGRAITIKSDRLAAMLIAYKNTWGIATSPDKRNKMSLAGVFSWVVFLPEIVFLVQDWWVFIATGAAGFCPAEENYLAAAGLYYIIAVSRKITEADRFRKGEIW